MMLMRTFKNVTTESNLIKYDDPRIYNYTQHFKICRETDICGFLSSYINRRKSTIEDLNYYFKKNCTFKEIEKLKDPETLQNTLMTMFPPIVYLVDNMFYHFPLSLCSASRLEIMFLNTCLDRNLRQRCAMNHNLCPIRRELFTDLCVELIRQITIQCPERGLLLLRIRNFIVILLRSLSNLVKDGSKFGCSLYRALNERAQHTQIRHKEVVNRIGVIKHELEMKECELRKLTDIEENKIINLIKRNKAESIRLSSSNSHIRQQIESIKSCLDKSKEAG